LVEAAHLRSPEADGVLNATAKLQLDAQPVSGEANIAWQGVQLPADVVGQPLATHGTLVAGGSAQKFTAHGELSAGPPHQLADLACERAGRPQARELRKLALKPPRGGLDAHGRVTLQPQTGWDVAVAAQRFDPGAFAKAWSGAIDANLSTNGQVDKSGMHGKL